MKRKIPFIKSHLPIKYHLSFTKQSGKWVMVNNLANGKQKMVNAHRERGVAAIMVVFVLVILLALISISFTKIMDRALQGSAADQQAKAADYAAQSAINDVLAYLRGRPLTEATQCNQLLEDQSFLDVIGTSTFGKPKETAKTKYTCILVDPTPPDLLYQSLDPYSSRVVQLDPVAGPATKLLFSWQSTARSYDQFPASGQNLYDEKQWADNKYAPLLRLTLYPMPTLANGDVTFANSNPKTYFFYPNAGAGITVYNFGDTGLKLVNCSVADDKVTTDTYFTSDYDCNVEINLTTAPFGTTYYYARITPIYQQASLNIKISNSAGATQFRSAQAVVDVTAKSGPAVKRLQAHVQPGNPSAGQSSIPDFALRTSNSICKRYVVPDSASFAVIVESGYESYCLL